METSQWHERFLQQAHWTETLRRHLYQRVGMKAGWRVLDVGCGTGALLPELCGAVRRVYALDIEPSHLSYAQKTGSTAGLVNGDGYELPFPARTFEACLCHFLLLWTEHPLQIVKEMGRVARPGGVVLALAEPDYGGRLDYPPELQRLGEMQVEALKAQGADPYLGRRLRALLAEAGLRDVHGGVLGGEWSQPPGEQAWEMEWRVLQDDLGQRLTGQEWQSLRRLEQAAWQSRRRVLFVPTFYAYGFVAE